MSKGSKGRKGEKEGEKEGMERHEVLNRGERDRGEKRKTLRGEASKGRRKGGRGR